MLIVTEKLSKREMERYSALLTYGNATEHKIAFRSELSDNGEPKEGVKMALMDLLRGTGIIAEQRLSKATGQLTNMEGGSVDQKLLVGMDSA